METFNPETGKGYSAPEVVHAFERVNGIKVPYEFAARCKSDVAENYADAAKSEEFLNWMTKGRSH